MIHDTLLILSSYSGKASFLFKSSHLTFHNQTLTELFNCNQVGVIQDNDQYDS